MLKYQNLTFKEKMFHLIIGVQKINEDIKSEKVHVKMLQKINKNTPKI